MQEQGEAVKSYGERGRGPGLAWPYGQRPDSRVTWTGPGSYSIATLPPPPKTRAGALVRVSQDPHLPSVFHAKKGTSRGTTTF